MSIEVLGAEDIVPNLIPEGQSRLKGSMVIERKHGGEKSQTQT